MQAGLLKSLDCVFKKKSLFIRRFIVMGFYLTCLVFFKLSPALRNRMTEIWCDVVHEDEDLTAILQHNLQLTLPVSVIMLFI